MAPVQNALFHITATQVDGPFLPRIPLLDLFISKEAAPRFPHEIESLQLGVEPLPRQ